MTQLPDDRDTPAEVMRRAGQEDPWVMYLVVRQDVSASATEVLLAGAEATMRCADALAQSPAWREAFEAWAARSFRKVSLRARGNAWTRLAAGYDAGVGHDEARSNELVRALPPRLKSACDPFLKNLQVYNPDPASLRAATPATPRAGEHPMTFALNPRATMSVGKQVAQVAHAVLMCAWSPLAEAPAHRAHFEAWRAEGYPGRFAPSDQWAALRASRDVVVVRDAGLTEVAPGTETVLARPPAPVGG